MRSPAAHSSVTAFMGIQVTADRLRWRVHLSSSPQEIYRLLATDSGRECFWAESSEASGDQVLMVFPDRSWTTMRVLEAAPPDRFVVDYFGIETTFEIDAVDVNSSVLRVTASSVPAGEVVDVAAGWVSVLLCLKAFVKFRYDLRNHEPSLTWNEGFVDN
jgi:uncharacterized protein YndB with AHSA1/START domain